jgi:hypothetical protein
MVDIKCKRKIGRYGEKDRALQRRLSYERIWLSWRDANVYLYLGDKNETDPSTDNIGNITFFETQDKAYEATPKTVPVWTPKLEEEGLDLSQFGYISPGGNQYTFKFHVESFVHPDEGLGRYIMNGDVFEVPFFEQDGNKAYFEVVDVDRKTEFDDYYVTVKATVLYDKREAQEIPDMNTNETEMMDIMNQMDTENDGFMSEDGLNTDDYDDYDSTQESYDSRNKNQKSFLDDPDAEY